jgi:hypothetical protein
MLVMNPDESKEENEIEQVVLRELSRQPLYMLEAASSVPYTQKQVAGAFERLSASGAIVVPRRHGRFQLAKPIGVGLVGTR